MAWPSLLLAVLAAVCNGSFGSLAKLGRCREVHPYVFNFWTCGGIVASGAALLAAAPATRVFEPWGLLSGALFAISTANAFMAIATIGLSVGSGVWCVPSSPPPPPSPDSFSSAAARRRG